MHGKYEKSAAFEKQLLEIADTLQDPLLITEAHRLIAETHVSTGAFEEGRGHYEQAASHYRTDLHPKFIAMLGSDSGVIAQSQLAYFTWSLGFPDQAIAIAEDVLEVAHELAHPFSLAIALDTISALYHQLRDPEVCFAVSRECIELCKEYGFVMWNLRAQMRQGWALAMLDDVGNGMNMIEDGLEKYTSIGLGISLPCMLALLAEAKYLACEASEGYELTSRALTIADQLNERYCEAEVHRIQGDCLMLQRDFDVAESAYRSAIKVAAGQKARSLELRGRLHLVNLLQAHGQPDAELSNLRSLFHWFQEGHTTSDLIAVRTILENPEASIE